MSQSSIERSNESHDQNTAAIQLPFRDLYSSCSFIGLAWVLFLCQHRTYINDEAFAIELHSSSNNFSNELRVQSTLETVIQDEQGELSTALIAIEALCGNLKARPENNRGEDWIITLKDGSYANEHESGSKRGFWLEIRIASKDLVVTHVLKPADLHGSFCGFYISGYKAILRAILDGQTQTIAEAVQICEAELDYIWQLNENVPPQMTQCMHDIFKEQARVDPQRPAVTSWDGSFTYGELEEVSDSLALELLELGIQDGRMVPLCFEKSCWAIAAVLAVMKTGAAIALMDPSQPEERLKTIVAQVQAKVVVTSESQAELGRRILPKGYVQRIGPNLTKVSRRAESEQHAVPILPSVPGSAVLYVQFTSGSTGVPKAIPITHANYTSGALPRADAVGYKSSSRVLDFPSYAFDVSIDCMLCTLARGGCICVPSEDARINDLAGAIRTMDVNMAHMTPSVARLLDDETFRSLDVLGLGGESITPSDASKWSTLTKVIIAYGPSECTVGCTIENDVQPASTFTTIGTGVGGVTWIVDSQDHNKLAPVGSVGELLIEGPIVADGYLNDADKTAVSFIEDPEMLLRGCRKYDGRRGRLYKTGDMVKYDPTGTGKIVFVGRADQQVKLRGQRVELGEIEYHVRKNLPAGFDVAAELIKPKDGNGDPIVVAFIAEKCSGNISGHCNSTELSQELRNALSALDENIGASLPRYMIPAGYVLLKEIPTLVSRKVDRKKLRNIGNAMSRQELTKLKTTSSTRRGIQTDAERQLEALWKQVLGRHIEVSADDSFFDIGGDSLRAMKLVVAARGYSIKLTVVDIFKAPKLSDMALKLTSVKDETGIEIRPFSLLPQGWTSNTVLREAASLCGVEESIVEDVYPCTPLQEGLMALSAKVTDAYVAQRVVQVAHYQSAEKLMHAFNVVSHDCPILRTRIVQIPRLGLMQVVIKEGPIWTVGHDLQTYLSNDRSATMDLGKPLSRFGVISDPSGHAHVILTIHHALYDGWSMPLLVSRINLAYQSQSIGQAPSFKLFIQHLATLDDQASRNYWRAQLEGSNPLQFPVIPKPGYQPLADSLLEHLIPLQIHSLSATSLASAIRGAWALVAARYTSSNDVIFGETLMGRNAPVDGVEAIEGPMITTVPLRIAIDRKQSVQSYLDSVHESVAGRIEHEHIGLQNIRTLSRDARDACELRTGLVIHPREDESDDTAHVEGPADGFVPVGVEDAAREALRFNSYALMLVCSFESDGMLVMASFDQQTVDSEFMSAALRDFEVAFVELCDDKKRSQSLDEIYNKLSVNKEQLEHFSVNGVDTTREFLKRCSPTLTDLQFRAWIIDSSDQKVLPPPGASGELVIQTTIECELESVEIPQRMINGTINGSKEKTNFYRTGQLAKWRSDGSLVLLGAIEQRFGTRATPREYTNGNSKTIASTGIQKELAALWSRVLRIEESSLNYHDSFFDIGGDSIGAMKLVSEARNEDLELSVAMIFRHPQFADLANQVVKSRPAERTNGTYLSYSMLKDVSTDDLHGAYSRYLPDKLASRVVDAYPVRPLQQIAITGTIKRPRYSARYEMIHFDLPIERERILECCQKLVSMNEILRTVFIRHKKIYFGVVLDELEAETVVYKVESEPVQFSRQLCALDAQTTMPLGSSFVKFFFVEHISGSSTLVFRLSHSQYDEICLPILLNQLLSLYNGSTNIITSQPFSQYVQHTLEQAVPASIPYWQELLSGSQPSLLRPTIELQQGRSVSKDHFATSATFSTSSKPRGITAATIPTAAWALVLARRVGRADVVFGEVVSGRNTGLPGAEKVTGPCWQYIPVRVRFEHGWTARDLLNFVQSQHAASAEHEGVGLSEVVKECVDWETDWPGDLQSAIGNQSSDKSFWFDTVVHQDVAHVEELKFGEIDARFETLYPEMEPLREWKIQAFHSGDEITMEVVTFEGWKEMAEMVLREIGEAIKDLMSCEGEVVLI